MSESPEEEVSKAGTFTEIGTTGLKRTGGFITEEFLPRLQGDQGRKKYQEMGDNDPIVSGVLFAIEMFLRQAQRDLRPPEEHEDSREAQEVVDFINGAYDDMSHTVEDHIGEVTSMFRYGWFLAEIVYKRRSGMNKSTPGKASRHDDGRIGWRKFAPRGQDTLWAWVFDERSGEVEAMEQHDVYSEAGGMPVTIPLEKALLFRTQTTKDNPEGKSILRAAYRPWYFKKRIEEIEAIGIERDLAGMPVIYAPEEFFDPDAPAKVKTLFNSLKTTVRNIRRDEQDGMVFPLAFDREGNERFRFELASTGGRRMIDTGAVVERYSRHIAMSVLADFIMLGHETVGSFALSDDKTDQFAFALNAWLDVISAVHTRHAIPRLMDLNGMDAELTPRLTFEPVNSPSIEDLAAYVEKLSKAGAPVFPDDNLLSFLYEKAGMPTPEPDEQDKVMQRRAELFGPRANQQQSEPDEPDEPRTLRAVS